MSVELQYQSIRDRRRRGLPLWVRSAGVVIALPCAAVVFVPFAGGMSPWNFILVFERGIAHGLRADASLVAVLLLALSFFNGLALLGWKIRLLISWTSRRVERLMLWIMALSAVLAVATALVLDSFSTTFPIPALWRGWEYLGWDLIFALPALSLLLWHLVRKSSVEVRASALLGACYCWTTIVCLRRFSSYADGGWFLAAVCCVLLTAEMLALGLDSGDA